MHTGTESGSSGLSHPRSERPGGGGPSDPPPRCRGDPPIRPRSEPEIPVIVKSDEIRLQVLTDLGGATKVDRCGSGWRLPECEATFEPPSRGSPRLRYLVCQRSEGRRDGVTRRTFGGRARGEGHPAVRPDQGTRPPAIAGVSSDAGWASYSATLPRSSLGQRRRGWLATTEVAHATIAAP